MTEDREESLDRRRAELGAKLSAKRVSAPEDDAKEASAEASRKGFAAAMKLSSEFISAIVVGGALGFGLDWVAGTSPWGLIVLLLLGFCAGVLNVLRASGKMAQPFSDDRNNSGR
ncbi:AtpZ/AtpI family protein [Oryzifoliimicrobium ureilyticus]|uniref:AtpZ/AtpI family protein n=1 Tax=Oryzifoliimicrobium ureilyticus TaxID=3113724 RepID=UPI00307665DB